MLTLISISNSRKNVKANGKWVKTDEFLQNQVELKFNGLVAQELAETDTAKQGFILGSTLKGFADSIGMDKLNIISDDEKYYIKSVMLKGSTRPIRFREFTDKEDTSVKFTYMSLWTASAKEDSSKFKPVQVSL
jgi:hypothetical protein